MAAGKGQFDIYQGPVGVTAVTNPVQRQILRALADGDLQLPDLVELTGKAKSTLSSIHMKELLSRELIAEAPHPSDSRRKVYSLVGRPMAATPENRPKAAVPRATSVAGPGLSIAAVLQVIGAAPARATSVVEAQAGALGEAVAPRLRATDAHGFATALARFAEEERLAHHLQLDFEDSIFRCRAGAGTHGLALDRLASMLAALATGAAKANGLEGVRLEGVAEGDAFVIRPYRS